MIPSSLRGRLVASYLALSLVLLIAVGGTLFVVLRGLHADSTTGSLSDLAGGVLPQVRDSVGSGNLRGAILDVRDELAARGIQVMIVGTDGRLRPIGGSPSGDPIMQTDGTAGDTLRGSVILDGERYLYAASVLRRNAVLAPRAVAFLAPDRSGAQALGDLGRSIPLVGLIVLLVAAPLAWLVARSVTRPLERVAAAAGHVPAGRAEALPLEGPQEVRALTATFNAMAAELDATRGRETELLANLRHDLRTPLTVIAGFATALRDGTATGEGAAAAACAIEEEAERMARLVDEMGAVERIRSGEDGLRPQVVDVPTFLAAGASRFSARALASGATLGVASAGVAGSAGIEAASAAPLTVTADRLALDRMLGNLVGNALEAVGHGGHVELVAGSTTLPDGAAAVWIGVVDDGPGFAPGMAARAFERFWRGDPARSRAGSGLGLAIVRELAMAHGGTVFAENVTPRGTRVGVILPVVPSIASSGPEAAQREANGDDAEERDHPGGDQHR